MRDLPTLSCMNIPSAGASGVNFYGNRLAA